jgi:RNA polymerase sigma-70 factor (ECF subfamily)
MFWTSDAALLAEWRRRGDPKSFTALVDRHAAMVHAASTRILRDPVLAEDVAQDCFMRLAQLERFEGTSVGGWLHRVARNRALDHLRTQSRRKEREDVFAAAQPAAASPDAQAILHEIDAALDALPEAQREALVLHYLEGRSHREIARALGLTRSAVTRRIHQALEQLREQLGVRGVSAGAGAVAATLLASLEGAQASAAAVVASLRKLSLVPPGGTLPAASAVPIVSAPVLAGGIVVLLAIIAISVPRFGGSELSNGVTGTVTEPSVAVSRAADVAESSPATESTGQESATPETADPTVEPPQVPAIHGVVMDAEGRGIAGARVMLFHNGSDWGLRDRVEEESASDEQGAFAFATAPVYIKPFANGEEQDKYIVMATHRDYAIGWTTLPRGSEFVSADVRLLEPRGGTILVVDAADSRPIEGARVWVYGAGTDYDPNEIYRDRIYLNSDPGIHSATTDESGVAFLGNLPNTNVSFRATKPGYAAGYAFREGRTVRLSRGAGLTGRIIDQHGGPVAGATVQLGAYQWMHQYFKTITHADGTFAFEDLPGDGWDMSAWKAGETGTGAYMVTVLADNVWVPGTFVGLNPVETKHLELEAQPGVKVRCKVVTELTRKPVAGARVQWFQRSFEDDPTGYTDERGEISFVTPPGNMCFIVRAPPEGTFWARDVWEAWLPDLMGMPAQRVAGPEMVITLTCPEPAGRLVTFRGSVIVPRDVAPGDLQICATTQGGLTLPGGRQTVDAFFDTTIADADGRYQFDGVPENVRVHVYAATRDRRYGGVVTAMVPGGLHPAPLRAFSVSPTRSVDYAIESDSLERTLKRKLEVRLEIDGEELRCGMVNREVSADENGIFHIPNVLPGRTYRIVDWESFQEGETKIDVTEILVP